MTQKFTPLEISNIKLKCLEMFVTIASKANIEQDTVFAKAKKAFKWVVEAPEKEQEETTE